MPGSAPSPVSASSALTSLGSICVCRLPSWSLSRPLSCFHLAPFFLVFSCSVSLKLILAIPSHPSLYLCAPTTSIVGNNHRRDPTSWLRPSTRLDPITGSSTAPIHKNTLTQQTSHSFEGIHTELHTIPIICADLERHQQTLDISSVATAYTYDPTRCAEATNVPGRPSTGLSRTCWQTSTMASSSPSFRRPTAPATPTSPSPRPSPCLKDHSRPPCRLEPR